MRRVACMVALALLAGGCFGPDPGLTSSGEGKPVLTLDAPPSAAAGDVVTVGVTVANPGPGEIGEVALAFARLGDPSLPYPIVEAGAGRGSGAVGGVSPRPLRSSEDGTTYYFEGLEEGAESTITFRLRVPAGHDTVGNAIQVYDSRDGLYTERAAGVPLKIEVRG